ncbi:serine hydrolase [Tautonia rosea]|uniref:serine hydrolase n=1 Tax=Tautonia rosea TaxID=2728037 RepID=UPI001474A961|nr:serine hydrolase [Tautonia rosea]
MMALAFPNPGEDQPDDRVIAAVSGLEPYIEEIRQKTGVPGLAITIVHKDEVVFLKGFGVRELGKPDAIDPDTVFQLASVSKPLTSSVIAAVVGEGIVSWDSKVSDLDPSFRLYDDFVSGEVTLRDLLCHRTGLPEHAGDLLEDLGYSRFDVLHRIRFQKPAGLFRASYAYTNFAFTQAGVATSKAVDTTWEDLATDRLFKPLGMERTSYRHADYAAASNRAKLHARVDGQWVAKYDRQPDAQAPAGGASSTARDLSRWMRLLIAEGIVDGKLLIARDQLEETFKPQVISTPAAHSADRTGFYGLGWNVGQDPNGRLTLSHSGAFDFGAATCVFLLPAENLGIVVLTNGAPIGVPEAVALSFFDLFDDGKLERDWFMTMTPVFEKLSTPNYGLRVDYQEEVVDRSPPLPTVSYLGRYSNEFVGDAVVAEEDNVLMLKLGPGLKAFPLTHFDRDTFSYQPEGEMASGLSGVTFRIGPDRLADELTIENLNVHGSGTLKRVPPGKK